MPNATAANVVITPAVAEVTEVQVNLTMNEQEALNLLAALSVVVGQGVSQTAVAVREALGLESRFPDYKAHIVGQIVSLDSTNVNVLRAATVEDFGGRYISLTRVEPVKPNPANVEAFASWLRAQHTVMQYLDGGRKINAIKEARNLHGTASLKETKDAIDRIGMGL